MSTQPLSHLKIVETQPQSLEDELLPEQAIRLLEDLTKELDSKLESFSFDKDISYMEFKIKRSLFLLAVVFVAIYFKKEIGIDEKNIWMAYVPIFLSFMSIITSILARNVFQKRHLDLKNKRGIYYSIFIPTHKEMTILQEIINKGHLLMNSPELSSWIKIELALKLRKAEETIIKARSSIEKYNPTPINT